jgi:hypothetical protein
MALQQRTLYGQEVELLVPRNGDVKVNVHISESVFLVGFPENRTLTQAHSVCSLEPRCVANVSIDRVCEGIQQGLQKFLVGEPVWGD